MDYTTIAVAFGMITLFLIVAEFFLPSGGLISLGALVCGAIAIWGARNAWAESQPLYWWLFLGSFIVVVPGALIVAFVILPKTRYGKRLFLEPQPAGESAVYHDDKDKLQKLIGEKGKTATLHTPAGFALVDGRRYHSESEGMMIDPDVPVEVIAIKANRLVIREQTEADVANDDDSDDDAPQQADPNDLDFHFPER